MATNLSKQIPALSATLKQMKPHLSIQAVEKIIKYMHIEPFSDELTKRILLLTGGDRTLLFYVLLIVQESGTSILDNELELLYYPPIKAVLHQMCQNLITHPIKDLFETGLINNNGTLFSKLLIQYIQQYELEGLSILFPKLTKTDRKLLSIFVQNPNTIIDKYKFSLILEQKLDLESDWGIYKAVERFKKKVLTAYTIKTIKGKGWILEI